MTRREDVREQCREKGIAFSPDETIKQLTKKIKKKEMAEKLKKGIVTEEQIAEWKKKYGTVHVIKVTVKEGDIAVGYLRKPNRNHKATALSMYAKDKILECGEFLRNNCWLGGDERLKDHEDIADTAAIQANGIVKFMEGELGEA